MPGIATPTSATSADLALPATRPVKGKLYIKTHGCQMNEYDLSLIHI